MQFILALLPIILILILMVGFRWSAARAGSAGYLSALIIAMLFFGAGTELIAYAHARAFLLALDVLMIIWAAFLLYRVADDAGAIRIIGQSLPYLTSDKGMQALVIGWVFASFLQGVGGFGVPVAVVAPILISMGFTPLIAVVIPSLGHSWAVTFGSMGSSFQALMAATGLPENVLAPPSAAFLGIACPVTGYMIAHCSCGWSGVRRLVLPVLLLGTAMATTQYLVAVAGFWFIAAFIAGLVGLVIAIPLASRLRRFNSCQESESLDMHPALDAPPQENPGKFDAKALVIALSGYAILIFVTLVIQLIPAVKESLSGVRLSLSFPETITSLGYTTLAGPGRKIVFFNHTGMILVYASILAYLVYRIAGLFKPGSIQRILGGTLKRVMSSSVSIASMVTMAVIMENSGMTAVLAQGIAKGTGQMFPFMSPWIGALGAFMTGSNTNSNVVFGALQMKTAQLLGFSVMIVLGAQTASAALASIMAPTKVVVGASTASMAGKEGEIMRSLVIYTIPLILLIGFLAWVGILLLQASHP
jgi:lactate permease